MIFRSVDVVTGIHNYVNMISDGTLGLAPPKSWKNTDFNFLQELKKNNIINQTVFSVYSSMDAGQTSHIKFGGYDEAAFDGECHIMKTSSYTEWVIYLDNLSIGDKNYYNEKKYMN